MKALTAAQVAELGQRLQPGDVLTCDGKPVEWEALNDKATTRGFTYVKYWKPCGVECTSDESVPGNLVSAVRKGATP